MKRLIVDLDDTVSITLEGDYINSSPVVEVIKKLKEYKEQGFEIVINSSRNMRTYKSNLGKINIFTLPNIIDWLRKYNVPFDEVYVGKPWCGFDGFYIDEYIPRSKSKKPIFTAGMGKVIMQTCQNVDEVRDFLSNYDLKSLRNGMIMYVDKSGSYLVVEADTMIKVYIFHHFL